MKIIRGSKPEYGDGGWESSLFALPEPNKERRTLTYCQEEPLRIAVFRAGHAWGIK